MQEEMESDDLRMLAKISTHCSLGLLEVLYGAWQGWIWKYCGGRKNYIEISWVG